MDKLQTGADAEALQTLPLEFSDICKQLRKGELPSLATVMQLVTEACQEAGVEAGFAAPADRQQFLEQADSLSGELATALRVTHLHQPTLFYCLQINRALLGGLSDCRPESA